MRELMPYARGGAALLRLFGLASLGLGVYLCVAHPLAPCGATLAFLALVGILLRSSSAGVVSLPAVLPVLSLAPWTGWRVVDEFDLFVLAVVAAGYWRAGRARRPARPSLFVLLLVVSVVLAAVAAGLRWPAPVGYASDAALLDGWRVAKSVLWTGLLWPLVRAHVRADRQRAGAAFFAACVLGAVAVSAAVFWERALYPGWFDFSTPYRTVALFWEMHHGGAALDAYLVLLVPPVVWAWRASYTPSRRLLAAVLVLCFVYALLTSFSRGVWGAALGACLVLALLSAWRRARLGAAVAHSGFADVVLILAVVLEVALVLGTGAFMGQRLENAENDLRGRWRHWQSGIELLQTPRDWLFGVGPGQLPRRWPGAADAPVRSGTLQWQRDGARASVLLGGPSAPGAAAIGGTYFLTQRVDADVRQPYRVHLDVRSARTADLVVQLCIQHLLYPAACRQLPLHIAAGDWQRLDGVLSRPMAHGCSWLCAGRGVLMLTVRTPLATVEIGRVSLVAEHGDVLRNGRFADGMAHWFAQARAYFVPWHIDNLYLELLIETGLSGLLLFVALLLAVIWRVWRAYLGGDPLAAYPLASILALLALGLVVSVLDMPRVATLFGLFLAWAWCASASASRHRQRRGLADDEPAAGCRGERRKKGEAAS